MVLGIEIGGTKLQLGIAAAAGESFVHFERFTVDREAGSEGILSRLAVACDAILKSHRVDGVGIGFGGPVDARSGVVIKSHHVQGWQGYPLAEWFESRYGIRPRIDNDCNVAAIAEAAVGSGRNFDSVFYVTVGTGIGGGYVIDGKTLGVGRPTISELGHLRPDPFGNPEAIVESYSSGPAIAQRAKVALAVEVEAGLQNSPLHELTTVTAKDVASAAINGDRLSRDVLQRAVYVLGWSIAQVINIVAPEVVVVGGGVSLIGDTYFFEPLREVVAGFVIAPLLGSYQVVAAGLGEDVVVHGAISIALAER